MAAKIGVSEPTFESDHQRKLRQCFDKAFAHRWNVRTGADGNPAGRTLLLANRFAIDDIFDLMSRNSDGYAVAAAVFARRSEKADRPVRTRILTSLTRMLQDVRSDACREIRESEAAHFGGFVNALLSGGGMDGVMLAWVEDMDASDPENDLSPEPTALIRGVLFSPLLDHRAAFGFWESASRSERFPLRVFSDPCLSEDGPIFSSYHVRAFGLFFAVAPESAVTRFAEHLRDHATAKMVREWAENSHKWVTNSVPASLAERQRIWNGIAGYIHDEQRRERVNDILHAVPEGPKTKAQVPILIGPINSAGVPPAV